MRGIGAIRKVERRLGLPPGTYGPEGEGSPWRMRQVNGPAGECIEVQVVRIHGNETLATFRKEDGHPGRKAKKHIARLIESARHSCEA